MSRIEPDELPGSARYAIHTETPGEIVWNRISVTTSLFVAALAAAFVLGRKN